MWHCGFYVALWFTRGRHRVILQGPSKAYTNLIRGFGELLILEVLFLGVKAQIVVDHPQRLLERLFKLAPDGHDFAHALHRRADLVAHAVKLFQIPPGKDWGDGATEKWKGWKNYGEMEWWRDKLVEGKRDGRRNGGKER